MKNGTVILASHHFAKKPPSTIDEIFDQLDRDLWWTLVIASIAGILAATASAWLSWPPGSCFAFAESYGVGPIGCLWPTIFTTLAAGMTIFVIAFLKVAEWFEERARTDNNGRQ